MAAAYGGMNLRFQFSDTYPLLMDHHSDNVHVVPIEMNDIPDMPTSNIEQKGSSLSSGSSSSKVNSGSNLSTGPSSSKENVVINIDLPRTSSVSVPSSAHSVASSSDRSASSNSPLNVASSSSGRPTPSGSSQLIAAVSSSGRSNSLRHRTESNSYSSRQHASPLNSGLWIALDMAVTVSQVIASIIVLSLSRNERPRAPLALWILGYAIGCLALLPHLYWRFINRAQEPEHDAEATAPATVHSSPTSHSFPEQFSSEQPQSSNSVMSTLGRLQDLNRNLRIAVCMERYKIALDCFFAIWFVVGNVWIFGGHSSAHEAPNLYRLCIVFLTFSCISYAMPFIICATVCCCLPCIITLLSYREELAQPKGAAPAVIEGLPVYKFKAKESGCSKEYKDGSDSDCESTGEGGTYAPGTDKERFVSCEDAVCCICLGKYKDGVDLKELHCGHFFHADCVDKWLKINASCPLCKHALTTDDQTEQSET